MGNIDPSIMKSLDLLKVNLLASNPLRAVIVLASARQSGFL